MGGQWFFVYRFGAIFRRNTAVEPPQNLPWYYGQGRLCPVRLLCFGVHFCRFLLLSFLPPSLAAFRSAWYARSGQGSSVSLPEVVALHRRGAYPIQAGHSIGIIHR